MKSILSLLAITIASLSGGVQGYAIPGNLTFLDYSVTYANSIKATCSICYTTITFGDSDPVGTPVYGDSSNAALILPSMAFVFRYFADSFVVPVTDTTPDGYTSNTGLLEVDLLLALPTGGGSGVFDASSINVDLYDATVNIDGANNLAVDDDYAITDFMIDTGVYDGCDTTDAPLGWTWCTWNFDYYDATTAAKSFIPSQGVETDNNFVDNSYLVLFWDDTNSWTTRAVVQEEESINIYDQFLSTSGKSSTTTYPFFDDYIGAAYPTALNETSGVGKFETVAPVEFYNDLGAGAAHAQYYDAGQLSVYYPALFAQFNSFLGPITSSTGVAVSSSASSPVSSSAHRHSSSGVHVASSSASSSITGDPQFVGFQGQSFQLHGIPDQIYSVISSPELQVNAKFVFLGSGLCNYKHTACWTHPGNYLGEVGVLIGSGASERKLLLKSSERSLTAGNSMSFNVTLDGQALSLRTPKFQIDQHTSVTVVDRNTIKVDTASLSFVVYHADEFFNIAAGLQGTDGDRMRQAGATRIVETSPRATLKSTRAYPPQPLHGLVGQTWRNVVYASGRQFEGEPNQYVVMDGLFGTDFVFNQH